MHEPAAGTKFTTQSEQTLEELLRLDGKVAIVTGGAQGIGRGIVERLSEAGSAVAIADVDIDAAESLVQELQARDRDQVLAIEVDVGQVASADEMVEQVTSSLGPIDILVNNAGVYPMGPVLEIDRDAVRRLTATNLFGLTECLVAAARQMAERGRGGRIINITSVDAAGYTAPGLAHYAASKYAGWGFTKYAALELAEYGIAVNAVAPGIVDTPGISNAAAQPGKEGEEPGDTLGRVPMGRMAEPDEIGRVVVFLAGGLSSYITGSQIVVDGGLLLG